MTLNYFEKLDGAFVAHFARRLADTVIDQSATLLRQMNLTCPPTSVSTVLYLHDSEQVTITDLANALGVTHQMAAQRVKSLRDLSLLEQIEHPEDKRSKVITLTKLGHSEANVLIAFTQELSMTLQKLNAEIGCNLSESIRKAEISLSNKPLSERINKNNVIFNHKKG